MAMLSVIVLCFVFALPFASSLSAVAVSETGNQTLVCAIGYRGDSGSFLNCTLFPRRIRIPLNLTFPVSGVVGGNGFLYVLTSSRTASSSIVVRYSFLDVENDMTFRKVYRGPILRELDSGKSRACGLVDRSSSLECWPRRNFNFSGEVFGSNLAVGEDFVCGLLDSGQVKCVGGNANVSQNAPQGNFSALAAGFRHVCGISLEGSLKCWGDMAGEMPDGKFTVLALGENRGCALRSDGTVTCWGENGYNLPVSLRNEHFFAIDGKKNIFCGVTVSNYSLLCWGDGDFDSRPLVFTDVLPGPCRPRNQCRCGPLPNYAQHCDQGLVICQLCATNPTPREQSPVGPAPPPLLPPHSPASRDRWDAKMVAFLVIGCVGSCSLLVALASVLLVRYWKDRGSSRIHDSGHLEQVGSPRLSRQTTRADPAAPALQKRVSHLVSLTNGGHLEKFSLPLLLALTDDFSEDHKIGTGSFGSVYRATLDDGREVAIKRAEASTSSSYATKHYQDDDKGSAFLNELEFLSRLNHKNLVRLLGYCDDSDELVLVYEHMNNCTLFYHLHKLENSPLMSWPKRIKIALDAARGVEYLHEFAVPRIIHRDIKSSNILLDSTWTAKVSDFGLSLMGPPDDETHLMLRAAGTMGYMDPEYYRLHILTTKSDVYSFGVLLLELLSGCKAIHKNENGIPRNLVDYVVPYIIRDEIHRILDRKVPPPTPFEIEAVAYVGYLAADCVMPEGQDRPTMTEVVNSLTRALEACLAPPVLSRSTTESTN